MRTPARSVLLLMTFPLLAGCGGHKFSKAEMDRARAALEKSLDAWKKGDRVDSLRSASEPIEFSEEWPSKGLRLLNYEILNSQHTDAEMIRFRVRLEVQDRRGRRENREVTYAVALKSPIAVGRDPFF